MAFYHAGAAQEIESWPIGQRPRLVLLVDSSANLKVEAAALQKAIEAVINELFQDDQMSSSDTARPRRFSRI